MKASEWAFGRIEEAFELVALDEAEKMSIVQEIMLKSTDYLRRIIAPVGGQEGVTMSYLFPCGRQRLVGLCEKIHKVVVRVGGVSLLRNHVACVSKPSHNENRKVLRHAHGIFECKRWKAPMAKWPAWKERSTWTALRTSTTMRKFLEF